MPEHGQQWAGRSSSPPSAGSQVPGGEAVTSPHGSPAPPRPQYVPGVPHNAGAPTSAPDRPKWRGRRHLLATLLVLVVTAAIMMSILAVFVLVLILAEGEEFETGAFLAGVASALGVSVGASLATLILGLILDRVTSTAPRLFRLAAPAPLAVVGIVLVFAPSDSVRFYVGFYLLAFMIPLSVYWAAFLLLGTAGRLSAWRARHR